MGDGADMALEDVMEMEELRLDYRLGNLSISDAYDAGIIDEFGREASASTKAVITSTPASKIVGNKTCSCCGRPNLYWQQVKNKWRLFEDGHIHNCPVKPL